MVVTSVGTVVVVGADADVAIGADTIGISVDAAFEVVDVDAVTPLLVELAAAVASWCALEKFVPATAASRSTRTANLAARSSASLVTYCFSAATDRSRFTSCTGL
jgi:hypothetical protein